MKRAPRSRQRHDLYAKYHDCDSEISDLLGECGLSHLFNQGVNAVELMRLDAEAVDRLAGLLQAAVAQGVADDLMQRIRGREYAVVFGIVTRKDGAARSLNLPLFSRISLMRSMKSLLLMDVAGRVMFIPDTSVAAAGRKKARKKKAIPVVDVDDVIEQ